MADGTTINASFGVNLEPLQRGFSEAEKIAKAGAARVARAATAPAVGGGVAAGGRSRVVDWTGVNSLSQSFRAPLPDEARRLSSTAATRGGYLPPARPGQYAMPAEEDEAGGRRGRGSLMRGLGGFSLLAAAEEAASYIKRKNEEAAELRNRVEATGGLRGSAAFQNSGDIESRLHAIGATRDEIFKRDVIERAGPAGWFIKKGRQVASGATNESDEEQRTQLRKQAASAIDDMAEKQIRLNSVESERMNISERQASLDEEEIKHMERLGALASAEAAGGVINGNARAAENERSRLATEAINRRSDRDDTLLGIRQAASYGRMTPGQARLASLAANRVAASDRGAQDIDASISEERFSDWQRDHGEGRSYDFDFHDAERRNMRDRRVFAAQDKDLADRQSRGAYNDSSSLSESKATAAITKAELEQVMEKYWGGN